MILTTERSEKIALLPELDINQTAKSVRKFFRHDWPHYLNRAGTTPAELKSPGFDVMPKSPSFENPQEHKMMVIFDAQAAVACVMNTLRSCREAHREVLSHCYIDGLPDWKVAQKMGYSDAQQQRIKAQACCEFAERLDYYQVKWGIELPELQVYKSNSHNNSMID